MSTPGTDSAARAAADTSRLKVGTAPDSWGVWFPDDPAQTPWPRFLDEVAAAGYAWLELGPYGYLPTDPGRLREELDRRGLHVSGGTVVGALQRPDAWEAALAAGRQVAALASAVGARYMVLLPDSYRDGKTGAFLQPRELDSDAWRTLTRAANEYGKIIAAEYGVRVVFHPHADSHVETQAQTERYLRDTDPRFISLCLDTGHISYRAGDNLALIRDYPDRIGYVHIKQMDPDSAAAANAEDISFGEAVRRGVCVEPPLGVPAIPDIAAALAGLNRDVFVIVEQDLYPCPPDVPLPIAIRTREYLRRCGLGADSPPASPEAAR